MKKYKVDDGYNHNTFLYKLLKPLLWLLVKILYNPKNPLIRGKNF